MRNLITALFSDSSSIAILLLWIGAGSIIWWVKKKNIASPKLWYGAAAILFILSLLGIYSIWNDTQ